MLINCMQKLNNDLNHLYRDKNFNVYKSNKYGRSLLASKIYLKESFHAFTYSNQKDVGYLEL